MLGFFGCAGPQSDGVRGGVVGARQRRVQPLLVWLRQTRLRMEGGHADQGVETRPRALHASEMRRRSSVDI